MYKSLFENYNREEMIKVPNKLLSELNRIIDRIFIGLLKDYLARYILNKTGIYAYPNKLKFIIGLYDYLNKSNVFKKVTPLHLPNKNQIYRTVPISNFIKSFKVYGNPIYTYKDIRLNIVFDNELYKQGKRGTYSNNDKVNIINLFFQSIDTMVDVIYTKNNKQKLDGRILKGIISYMMFKIQATIHHELIHWVQDNFLIDIDEELRQSGMNYIQPETDFEKYNVQEYEFYPKLISSLGELKQVIYDNKKTFNNIDFKKFTNQLEGVSNFFTFIKKHRAVEYNRALRNFIILCKKDNYLRHFKIYE